MTWKEFRLKNLGFILGPVKEDYIKKLYDMAHEDGYLEGLEKGRKGINNVGEEDEG